MNAAIRRIKADPGWLEKRHLAPAGSRHHGKIVDLSVGGHAIVYRTMHGGREVEVVDIYPVFIG